MDKINGEKVDVLKERRFKILRMGSGQVADLFNLLLTVGQDGYRVASIPDITPLPRDVLAVACHSNFHTNSIEFLLASESFEPVPFGEQYPDIIGVDTVCNARKVTVQQVE